jgi:mono/diheme cytochrome c family protein
VNASRIVLLIGFTVVIGNASRLMQHVPEKATEKHNPFQGDEKAERAGAKLYSRECASCHGAAREGWRKAPPLVSGEIRNVESGKLFWVLKHGSLGHGMPSFAHLPEAQRWQIITFLQTQSK